MSPLLAALPADAQQRQGWPFTEQVDPIVYSQYKWLPKISIITPSYNQSAFIEETLRSVILQNYPNLEFLVIDGGSKDGSVDIIKRYEPWITYWVSEKDRGTFDADNKGLERMTGDYWLVLNSDDTLLPNAFEDFVKLVNQGTPPDWVTGGIWAIDEHSRNKAQFIPQAPKPVAGFTFANRCWIFHPSTFLSAKVYQVVGKFRNTDIMDYDYWLRMEEVFYKPVVLEKHVAGLRFHSECKSYDYLKIIGKTIEMTKSFRQRRMHDFSYEQIEEYNRHIAQLELDLDILEAKTRIVEGEKLQALGKLFNMSSKRPAILATRWYWGAVRRVFTGMKAKEVSPQSFLID